MDCVIEILLRDTDAGTVERKTGDIMNVVMDGFKGRSREDFAASADAHAALASMSGGIAKVRVCKIG